jgi:hypothetical protein
MPPFASYVFPFRPGPNIDLQLSEGFWSERRDEGASSLIAGITR